jgi:hypothetical protein
LLTLPWILVGAVLCLAAVAFERARRLSKRLERLTESYWDLRYEVGQLQARVKRLEPGEPDALPSAAPQGANAFIPVSSLKR